MNPDLLNILSNSNKDINDQQLMDYIAGKLSAEEKHQVEMRMAESEFMNDAVEGLQQVKGKKNLEDLVNQLNTDLQKKLEQKKTRKEKRKIKEYPWIYLSIILILALVIIAWYVINRIAPGVH